MRDDNRKGLTDNQWLDLFSEQNGLCFGPKCNRRNLIVQKGNKRIKIGEGAHIYPLNASEKEKKVLEGVEVLGEQLNHLSNIILLCPNCHTYFDKERDLDSYIEMVNIKKEIIRHKKTLELYNELYVEEELKDIIDIIIKNPSFKKVAELTTEFKDISDKMGSDYDKYIINTIKYYFQTFYIIINDIIKSNESPNSNTFKIVSSQVRTAYLKFSEENPRREVYNILVDWLQELTKKKRQYCEVVISYFIQSCEVFSDVRP